MCGAAIAMSVRANIGVGPWEAFHIGISKLTGISMGTASITVSLIIIIMTALSGERFGCGTIANMLVIGVSMDAFLNSGLIPEMETIQSGVAMILLSRLVTAFAIVIYMGAGYGSGPRDGMMVMLSKLTSRPPGYCKAAIEALALLVGWLLGGPVGVGTVVSVLCVGPLTQFAFRVCRFDVKAIRHESVRDTLDRISGRRSVR